MKEAQKMTPEARRLLWQHMRVPAFAGLGLLTLLGGIVVLGQLAPSGPTAWIIAGLTASMALVVLLFSMEVREEPPLMRFFSGLGFAWLTIILCMTLLDYASRGVVR